MTTKFCDRRENDKGAGYELRNAHCPLGHLRCVIVQYWALVDWMMLKPSHVHHPSLDASLSEFKFEFVFEFGTNRMSESEERERNTENNDSVRFIRTGF